MSIDFFALAFCDFFYAYFVIVLAAVWEYTAAALRCLVFHSKYYVSSDPVRGE